MSDCVVRKYKIDDISERSHVDELEDHVLWEVGRQLSDNNGEKSYWRWLASELGLDNNDIARIRPNPADNPGYEVIRCWSKQSDSSIRVLKNVLRDVLKCSDLVATIDKARQNVVYLTATLLCEGTTAHDLSGRFPGSRPIIEFIRPKILRMFSSDVLSRQCSLSIIMYSSDDRNWSTPAKLFQGRQITLEKFIVRARQNKSEKKRHGEKRPIVERTVISESCDVVFEVRQTDSLNSGHSTWTQLDDDVEQSEPFGEQEESRERQQTQEEDANAESAKVIA